MKLTRDQVEARMSKAWGQPAYTVPYRIAGNRYEWAVTDHDAHWMPLASSWEGGRQVLEPVGNDTWPEPEPDHDRWVAAVGKARQRARAYFTHQENLAALRRLPRAVLIAESRNWQRLGDEQDTWLMPSQTTRDHVYRVNGRCTCLDYLGRGVPGGWCKHRLGRGLALRAQQILGNNGAGGAYDTPAPSAVPHGNNGQDQDTTPPFSGQARRIDLILAYKANEMNHLAHVNANGKLVRFLADGQQVQPPVQSTPEIYRWLQAEGYVPHDFQWLHWEQGLRQRRQTYIRSEDHTTALPVQYSRGRSKLFKE